MLWLKAKRNRWQMTFSKSMLVLFMMQIVLSAACISTANANAMSQMASLSAHCHNEAMSSDMAHVKTNTHTMSACSHCDIPDMGLSAQATTSIDITPVLLAIIILPDMPSVSLLTRSVATESRAPPHSFSLLYHTNQRILI